MRKSRQTPPGDLDRALRELAGRQHEVVARRQLLGLGLGAGAVDQRLANGRLRSLHRGVYTTTAARDHPEAIWMAAVLTAGTTAVLSHHSAAALWRLRTGAIRPVHVSVPRHTTPARRRGLTVHRMPLDDADTTRRARIPVTTPQRTILDLAPHITSRQLERATDEAVYLNLLSRSSLGECVSRNTGRHGANKVQALIGRPIGTTRTRSTLEEALLAICDRHGVPRPRCNQRIDTIEVDFTWPSQGLAVEADAYATHSSRAVVESDRRREPTLRRAGYRLRRFSDTQIRDEPEAVAAELRAELGLDDDRSRRAP